MRAMVITPDWTVRNDGQGVANAEAVPERGRRARCNQPAATGVTRLPVRRREVDAVAGDSAPASDSARASTPDSVSDRGLQCRRQARVAVDYVLPFQFNPPAMALLGERRILGREGE